MATHKGTVLDALIGRHEGWSEFLRPTEGLNIDGTGSAGMVFQADIHHKHRPDQNAGKEKDQH